jgi:MFS family permease
MMSISALARRAPAFRHRNFRLYFFGQVVSVIGSWIQTVTISWTLYDLTHSAILLGVSAFLIQGPQLLLTPFAGVWVDYHDRRKMLTCVQVINLGVASGLACLAITHVLASAHLLVASALLGLLNSFDAPLRQSLLVQLINDRKDLSSAIALNASVFTTGRFLGPPIAGFMLSSLSSGAAFLTNAGTFVLLIAILIALRLPVSAIFPKREKSVMASFLEGLRYAKQKSGIRIPLGLLASINLTASSAIVLAPVFVRQVFHGSTSMLGWLMGSAGAGAVLGTIVLSRHQSLGRIASLLIRAPVFCITGLLLLCVAQTWWLASCAMFLIGAGVAVTNVTTNALLQNQAREHLRGRVIALFVALRFGMDALGGLIAGFLSSVAGVNVAMLIELIVLFAALSFWIPKLYKIQWDARSSYWSE